VKEQSSSVETTAQFLLILMLQKINIINEIYYEELLKEIMSERRVLVTFYGDVWTKAVRRPINAANQATGIAVRIRTSVRGHAGWRNALGSRLSHVRVQGSAGDRSDQSLESISVKGEDAEYADWTHGSMLHFKPISVTASAISCFLATRCDVDVYRAVSELMASSMDEVDIHMDQLISAGAPVQVHIS
jgi:hypothetical protein